MTGLVDRRLARAGDGFGRCDRDEHRVGDDRERPADRDVHRAAAAGAAVVAETALHQFTPAEGAALLS